MTNYEKWQIANNIHDALKGELTPEKIIAYVNDNFFTFSEYEKREIINYMCNALWPLPF